MLACGLDDHAMVSQAVLWRDGVEVWSVSHVGSEGGRERTLEGAPPPLLAELTARSAARYAEQPEGTDFAFDVPIDLAASLTAFRHDEGPDEGFEELEDVRPAPARKGFFARFFG